MCFFRRQNSEILRPLLAAVWKPQFFLKGNFEIGETPPPPLLTKNSEIFSVFFMIKSLLIGCDPPLDENTH